jgi:hypothetical protein
MKKKQAAKAKV